MVDFIMGMVVESRADRPRSPGRCSCTAAAKALGATSWPRSMTSKPAPCSMIPTSFLPMSCTSPFTVPSTILPRASAPQQVRAQHLDARVHGPGGHDDLRHEELPRLEVHAHQLHARHQAGVQHRRRVQALFQALPGQGDHALRVPVIESPASSSSSSLDIRLS